MRRALRQLGGISQTVVLCLLSLALLASISAAQVCTHITPPECVLTWHNDSNRTGWQQGEMTLSANPNSPGYVSQSTFGLLWQWPVTGYIYAQPLAGAAVNTSFQGCQPCDLVFVATEQDVLLAQPLAINAYQMATSGTPISQTPTASTVNSQGQPVRFCQYTPTPSGSWNSVTGDPTTGIFWAIEHQNAANPGGTGLRCNGSEIPHAALHAFTAVPSGTSLTELYNSGTTSANQYIGDWITFSTPTIFSGRVYMGTQTEVDAFGICNGACKQ